MGVKIDYNKDSLLSEQGLKLVKDYYLKPDETSPQEAFARASEFFSTDSDHAQRLYDAVSNQHFMFSSPILSNSGPNTKGMPISCFLTYVPDTVDGLINHTDEFCYLSVLGGGVGGHWDDVRGLSDKSPGPIPFMHTIDAAVTGYKQGKTRKGAYAAYLDVKHPVIQEFVQMRVPTGGDINRKNFNIHNAVNLSDEFMQAVKRDGMWDLSDPHSFRVTDTVRARELWESILETRHRTGEPFLNWIDTINRSLHPSQKDLGLKIRGSNLCLTGDTIVPVLHKGNEIKMPLKDIVESDEDLKVLSVNTYSGRTTYESIVAKALMAKDAELYEITDEKGNVVKCTGDHEFYTQNRGYVAAKDLVETDELVSLEYSTYSITNSVTKEHRLSAHLYRSIRKLDVTEDVYDITVAKNHNFFANDILVHNCNEIHLPTDEERTAVCCLASLNLETYDEWPNTLVSDVIELLDNVIEYFITNAPDSISKAKYAAMRSRDLGLGAMGWHGYLMKNSIPFESDVAIELTDTIFKYIRSEADNASSRLAEEKGACPDSIAVGGNERNLHKLAIAPNANSSSICNATASIELISSNAFPHRTRAGTHLIVNKYLAPMLMKYAPLDLLKYFGMSVEEWLANQISEVVKADGSVQGLSYISDHDKEVFKTFKEVDMMAVVEQAGVRQKHLCQGQSLNVWFDAAADKAHLNAVHLKAYELGVKGMYYLRTGSVQKIDKISTEVVRATLDAQDVQDSECTACHA